jgi:DNA-binding CsgD family transcriptional regulator
MDAIAQLADLRLRQGRLEEAEALLSVMDDTRDLTLAAAGVRIARGEPAVAVGILQRRARLLGEHHIETAATLALLVEAHLGDDDLAAAREVAAGLRAVADAQDRGLARALAVVASARIAAAESRTGEAIEDFERALRHLADLHRPLDTARVRLELARLLATDRQQLAVAEATQALATFEHLGATADADAAAALLRELGAPSRSGPKKIGPITLREQDVLRLVGNGLTNPEIAQRLFISRKTASNHVSNILTKLGLRNRAELAAYAVTQPAGPPSQPLSKADY